MSRRRKRKEYTEEDLGIIRSMHSQDAHPEDIANELGRRKKDIQEKICRMGLGPRSRFVMQNAAMPHVTPASLANAGSLIILVGGKVESFDDRDQVAERLVQARMKGLPARVFTEVEYQITAELKH